jgi:hypothetical protein
MAAYIIGMQKIASLASPRKRVGGLQRAGGYSNGQLQTKNFHARRAIAGSVIVSMPTTTLAFVKGTS